MVKNSVEAVNLIITFLDRQVNAVKEGIFEDPLAAPATTFKFGVVHALKTVKIECEKFIKELQEMESSPSIEEIKNEFGLTKPKEKKKK